eukprot:RCo003511
MPMWLPTMSCGVVCAVLLVHLWGCSAATFNPAATTMTCDASVNPGGTANCQLKTWDTTGAFYIPSCCTCSVNEICFALSSQFSGQISMQSVSGTTPYLLMTFPTTSIAAGTAQITVTSAASAAGAAHTFSVAVTVNSNVNTGPIDPTMTTISCSPNVSNPNTHFTCSVTTRTSTGIPCACSTISDFTYNLMQSNTVPDTSWLTATQTGMTLSATAAQPSSTQSWVAGFNVIHKTSQASKTGLVILTGSVSATATILTAPIYVGDIATIVFSGQGLRFQNVYGGYEDTVRIVVGANADCTSGTTAAVTLGTNPGPSQNMVPYCSQTAPVQQCAAVQYTFPSAGQYTICYTLALVGTTRMSNTLTVVGFDPSRSQYTCSPSATIGLGGTWTCTLLTFDTAGNPCSCLASGDMSVRLYQDATTLLSLTPTSTGYVLKIRVGDVGGAGIATSSITYNPTNVTYQASVYVLGLVDTTFSFVPVTPYSQ